MRKTLIIVAFAFMFLFTGCNSAKADYQNALEQMEQGNFCEAIEIFNTISDYEDSLGKIKECKYILGMDAFNSEEWENAILLFEGLDYKDSSVLMEKCIIEREKHKNADYDFLNSLEKSILDRMDNVTSANYDSATVVNTELVYVEKFREMSFYDSNLADLAEKYIEGLYIQKEALKKEELYQQQIEWQRGIVKRYEVLRDLYEQYGFLADNVDFVATYVSAFDDQSALLDAYNALEADIGSQTASEEFEWWLDGNELYCILKNNTDYRFSTTFDISFIDADGVIFEESSDYIENISAGSSYKVSFYISSPEKLDGIQWSNYYNDIVC